MAGTFTIQDIGGCNCVTPACNTTVTGTVRACGGVIQGVTVTAYDTSTSGSVLGSTTTSSSGIFTLNLAGVTTGNFIVVTFVFGASLTSQTVSLSYLASGTPSSGQWGCNKTTTMATVALQVAAGYMCCGCPVPISQANPLHLTDSVVGAVTLTWNGTRWAGSTTYAYPGCSGCSANNVVVTYTWDCTTLQITWECNATTFCPAPGAGQNGNTNWSPFTCSNPNVYSLSGSKNAVTQYETHFYCPGAVITWTITS
jgi:hypothetical protein